MINHRHRPLANFTLLLFTVFLVGVAQLSAQTNQPRTAQPITTKMNVQRLYYESPNQDKVKMEVVGHEVTIQGAEWFITSAKINNYSAAGGPPQLIAETPLCTFNSSTWQITSTNILQARSGNSNYYVEGVGFLWQKISPDLTLSNHVHTIIYQNATNAGAKTNSRQTRTDIHSTWATFDSKAGEVIYHEQVRVTDPHLNLACALLTVKQTQGAAVNQLDHVLAETNVIMDYTDDAGRKTHATSDRAIFTHTTEPVTNEVLELSGHPRLESTNDWMTADVFILNRTTDKIQGRANCRTHTRMNLGANTNAAASETDITSEYFDYDSKSGLAIYRKNVRVHNPQLNLTCETLTAASKAGSVNNIVAEENVSIDFIDEHGEKTHATSEKAVYSASVVKGMTNKVLTLTGNPVLERTNGWIMADVITLDSTRQTIRGEGNHHTIYKTAPGKVAGKAPPAAPDTEIFSDRFDYAAKTGTAVYRGNVRVINPEMRLQSQHLIAKFPESGATNNVGRPRSFIAETNVVVDYFKEKGDKTHATCENMVYTNSIMGGITNEVLVLTGNPIVDMTDAKGEKTHAVGDKIVYTSTVIGGKPSELVKLIGHPKVDRQEDTMTSDDVIVYDRQTKQAQGIGNTHIVYAIKPGASTSTNNPPAPTNAPPK